MIWGLYALAFWAVAWAFTSWAAKKHGRSLWAQLSLPILFGVTVLVVWEGFVRALEIPEGILPPPTKIYAAFQASTEILWIDFMQTAVKGALRGLLIGCAAGVLGAVVIDRVDFLRRGLLPVANFFAAMPIVGIAPIMVAWFGFGWESKAAVVVVMVFFPMLVNTLAGLAATDRMQRDLMATYSASHFQTLLKLRLPAAMPFIFNGLKIAATLALIGAIVAEYFGSPTRGMGFRITTEMGLLRLDFAWAEIAVAALAGSVSYGLIALIERWVTFWHPSQRR